MVKLRKLQRVKARKFRSRNPQLNHYLQLYWNYWFQSYPRHAHLWDVINETNWT
jgi:hypothetical protein